MTLINLSFRQQATGNRQQATGVKVRQTWIVHHLLIIGEAAGKVSDTLKNEYPDIPWLGMIDVRNIIAHEYFRIDLNIIWRIVEGNLLSLKRQIENILHKLE